MVETGNHRQTEGDQEVVIQVLSILASRAHQLFRRLGRGGHLRDQGTLFQIQVFWDCSVGWWHFWLGCCGLADSAQCIGDRIQGPSLAICRPATNKPLLTNSLQRFD